MKKWRGAVPIAGLLLLAATLGLATPASGTKSGNVSSRRVSATAQHSAKKYWTPARMAAAKPPDMTVTAAQVSGSGGTSTAQIGAPSSIPPSPPGGAAGARARATGGLAGTTPVSCCPGAAYSYPAPFTRYALFPTSLYTLYPYRAHGKIFFTQGTGNFVCSGTVVSSVGHWLVETAGHCVANSTTHAFSTNVLFVPAYLNNVRPLGTWTAFKLWTKTAWISSGNQREDRGFILLNKNSSGQSIQTVTGAEGIAFNQGYLQHFVDLGYPAASPFSGQTEQVCLGSTEETDPFIGGTGSLPLGIGCDMTGGSSGGGWVIQFRSGGGFVNGHNDYQYTTPARPREMFSPYFDNSELSLYNCATDNVC